MSTVNNFIFSEAHFNRIFPFYILLNQDMMVEANGSTLEKLFAGTKGKYFFDHYSIKRPEFTQQNFQSVKAFANQLLVIECFNIKKTNLRGQIEYLPVTNQLLFMGSPWFDSIEEVTNNNLCLNDFAHHDAMTDLLQLMNSHASANKDLKLLLHTVKEQKNELKLASQTIKDLALFTTQDPDPILRINYEGDILQNNPAAARLDFFQFENEEYRNDELFKLIAERIDKSASKWSFEAQSESRIYSFICVTKEEEQYINIYGRDITQSRKDEEQLRSLSLIIQQTKQGILITDAHSKIEWVNHGFEEHSGYTLDELKGRTAGSVLQGPNTDPETVKYMKRQIKKKKPFICEIINYKKSGEEFWKKINAHPVFDSNQNLIQYFGIEEDITAQKNAQEKIREAANRMSLLITNLQAGILLVNDKREVELVNERFCDLFYSGANPSEIIGSQSEHTITQAKQYFKDPDAFVAQTAVLIRNKQLVIGEQLETTDGKTLKETSFLFGMKINMTAIWYYILISRIV